MTYLIAIAAAALSLMWMPDAAHSQANKRFDVGDCREQAQAFARLDIDCVLTIKAAEKDLAAAPSYLRALLGDFECKVPLAFDKAQVYGVWITENRVNPPPLDVSCTILSGLTGGDITAVFDVDCIRNDDTWTCFPGLRDVVGLGPLAPVIEDFVNNEPVFPRFLAKQLSRFD